jgi:hypothetical protein
MRNHNENKVGFKKGKARRVGKRGIPHKRNYNKNVAERPNTMHGELERGVPTHMKGMKMTTQGSTRKEDEPNVG